MGKKTIIAVVIIIAIVVVGALYFFVFREQFDPLSNLDYINKDDNFGLNPPEGWIVKEHNDGSSVISVSIYYPPNNLSSFIQIDITPPPPGSNIKLDEQVDNFMQNYFPQFDPENFSSFTHNNRTVNGMDAYEFQFIVKYSVNITVKEKIILVENNNKLFLIDYKGTFDLYDKYELAIEESINTLVII